MCVALLALSSAVYAQQDERLVAANKTLTDSAALIGQDNQERFPAMIARLEEARKVYQERGSKTYEAFAALPIGRLYSEMKEQQKAVPYLEASLALWREAGEKNGEATTLAGLGRAYSLRSEKRRAADAYQQAVTLFEAVDNRSSLASVLDRVAAAYNFLGERE
ncbi:MAG TPA: tetratricopeptide repeat protein [Pyrinomonadaceae bacterium]|nr:tetratricopeptide repeat protein [Pyrinomonadaceae bacterium]